MAQPEKLCHKHHIKESCAISCAIRLCHKGNIYYKRILDFLISIMAQKLYNRL